MPGRLNLTSPSHGVDGGEQLVTTVAAGTSTPNISSRCHTPEVLTWASPLSPTRAQKTRIRNRRLRYLQKNATTYFCSPDLELADPLLYDRLIRQFLTPAEREAQGRERGWSGVLEADLIRAEAKLAAIANSEADTEARAENEKGEPVTTKAEGDELWKSLMTLRFIEGKDKDIDYDAIDWSEEWDDIETEKREEEEKYFDAETPSSVSGTEDTGVQDY